MIDFFFLLVMFDPHIFVCGGYIHFFYALMMMFFAVATSLNYFTLIRAITSAICGTFSFIFHRTKTIATSKLDYMCIHINLLGVIWCTELVNIYLSSIIITLMSVCELFIQNNTKFVLFNMPIPRILTILFGSITWVIYLLTTFHHKMYLAYLSSLFYILAFITFSRYQHQLWHQPKYWGPHEDFHLLLVIAETFMFSFFW